MTAKRSAGSGEEGEAYLFYGPVTGSMTTESASAVFTGGSPSDSAGTDVGFLGDFDGSGDTDFFVSAVDAGEAGTSAGAVYLVLSLGM